MARFRWAALALVLVAGMGRTDGPDKKDVADAKVEMRFADGSVVQGVLLEQGIEVQTKYGKLTVPAGEVRRIDFAYRLPDAVARKVEAAVKNLGNEDFKTREAAVKELAALKAQAVPALRIAAKSTDAEVARRAREALKQIEEKIPAEQLVFPANDRIHAAEFSVVGRIVSPTLKAKTAYFGEVQLQLHDLRSLRNLGSNGEVTVTVDAGKYGGQDAQWMETEVSMEDDTRLEITASGEVDLWPDPTRQYVTGPSGYKQGGGRGPHLPGTLVGRIGPNGTVFAIGDRYQGTAAKEGKLYLHIVPSPWGNASTGSYRVKVVQGAQ